MAEEVGESFLEGAEQEFARHKVVKREHIPDREAMMSNNVVWLGQVRIMILALV